MPEKQCAGSEREKKQIRHLAASPVVLSIAVSQTSRRATRQINLRYFISAGVYFAGPQISIKVRMLSRVTSSPFALI